MGKFQQFYTAFACSFPSLVMGLVFVWPSYSLHLYTSPNSTVVSTPMSEFEGSLLSSLPSLGAMVGTASVGLLIDSVGRQKGGILLSLPSMLSWVMIDQSRSTTVVLIARFISGMTGGACMVYSLMFISEIAEDSIRGALASGTILLYCLGTLMSYLLGWFLSHQLIIWINILCSALGGLLCLMVVESPLYLLRQNREQEAVTAISKYRGASPDSKEVMGELSRIRAQIIQPIELVSVTEDTLNNDEKSQETEKEKLNPEKHVADGTDYNVSTDVEKMSKFKMIFYSTSSRRAFVVVFTLITLQVFMGMVPVMVYAKTLFSQAAPSLSSHFCSVLLAVCVTSGSMTVTFSADVAGRKALLIASSSLVAVTMTSLAFLLQTDIAPAWVCAVIMLVYCFAFNLGAGSIPYVLLAEVFVSEVQGIASMLLVEWAWFLNFFIILIFPTMNSLIGVHGVFYIFAVVAVCDAAYSWFCVPETKGLSIHEIQGLLRK